MKCTENNWHCRFHLCAGPMVVRKLWRNDDIMTTMITIAPVRWTCNFINGVLLGRTSRSEHADCVYRILSFSVGKKLRDKIETKLRRTVDEGQI
jgi:hypothetical protein